MPQVRAGRHIKHHHVLPKGKACTTCRTRRVRCDGVKPQCGACARTARHKGRGLDFPACECEYAPSSSNTKDSDAEDSQDEKSSQTDSDSLEITRLEAHMAALERVIRGNMHALAAPVLGGTAASPRPYYGHSYSSENVSSASSSSSISRLSSNSTPSSTANSPYYSPYSSNLPECGFDGSTINTVPYLGLEEVHLECNSSPDYTLNLAYSPFPSPRATKRRSFATEFPFPVSSKTPTSYEPQLPVYALSFPFHTDIPRSSFMTLDFATELRQAQTEHCSLSDTNWGDEPAALDSISNQYQHLTRTPTPGGVAGARQFSIPFPTNSNTLRGRLLLEA